MSLDIYLISSLCLDGPCLPLKSCVSSDFYFMFWSVSYFKLPSNLLLMCWRFSNFYWFVFYIQPQKFKTIKSETMKGQRRRSGFLLSTVPQCHQRKGHFIFSWGQIYKRITKTTCGKTKTHQLGVIRSLGTGSGHWFLFSGVMRPDVLKLIHLSFVTMLLLFSTFVICGSNAQNTTDVALGF